MPACIPWGEERHQECLESEHRAFEECSISRAEGALACARSGPLLQLWLWPWMKLCDAVCVAWAWCSNAAAIAWVWLSTACCVAWDVLTTALGALLVSLESIAGWWLSSAALLVELLQLLPGAGPALRWSLNALTHALHAALSSADTALGLLGIRPEKKLRLCTIVLRDERGAATCTPAHAVALLQLCSSVYKRDANVRLVPSRPFQYSTGFSPAEAVDASWLTHDPARSSPALLDVAAGSAAFAADWSRAGAAYHSKQMQLAPFGSWRRVTGYGAPITCFIVRSAAGTARGSATWISDYVTVQGNARAAAWQTPSRVLAHQVAHACNLTHTCVDDDDRNLMATQDACQPESETAPDRANPRLSNWQVIQLRASKHVTYF